MEEKGENQHDGRSQARAQSGECSVDRGCEPVSGDNSGHDLKKIQWFGKGASRCYHEGNFVQCKCSNILVQIAECCQLATSAELR